MPMLTHLQCGVRLLPTSAKGDGWSVLNPVTHEFHEVEAKTAIAFQEGWCAFKEPSAAASQWLARHLATSAGTNADGKIFLGRAGQPVVWRAEELSKERVVYPGFGGGATGAATVFGHHRAGMLVWWDLR